MSDIIDVSHPRYSWPPKSCLTPDSLYTTKISPGWIEINVSFPRSNLLTLTEPEAIDLDNRLHRAVEIAIAYRTAPMNDIAHIIQVELDRLNHSVEPFANYGRHVAATLSRLKAPPPGEIAKLIEYLDEIADSHARVYPHLENRPRKAAAALRSLAQEVDSLKTKRDIQCEIENAAMLRIQELEAERDAIRNNAIEECAQEIQEEFDRPDMADAIRVLATASDPA